MVESDEILVSVSVLTYNHEKYIEETLVSILSQKVNFRFEVLVHDDASTDSTIKIIERLRIKNPDIIKVIYQSKNQYSKGIKINSNFNLTRVKGKYVAFCEGDDYWCDENKLQKQVEALEAFDCDMCFHPTIRRTYLAKNNANTDEFSYGYFGNETKVIDYSRFIRAGGGLIGLSSMLIRNKRLQELRINNTYFFCYELTHFMLQLIGSKRAGAIYTPYFMSVYRSGVEGSWTASNKSSKINLNNMESYIKRVRLYGASIDKTIRLKIIKLVLIKVLKILMLKDVSLRNRVGSIYRALKNRK